MKNKVCFVCVYFGKFPNYYNYWLQCCRHNKDFTWLIITDNKDKYEYPENVIVEHTSLEELKCKIETLVAARVNIDKPYKLCDYRPLYANIFNQELQGFTHWGYMDFDLIFGCLKNHFTDEIIDKYDKVSALGHVTVIKKTPQMVELYKTCDYLQILQNPQNRTFDELMYTPNINQLIIENGLLLRPTIAYADIGASHYNFYTYTYHAGNKTQKNKYIPTVFLYRDGKTYQCTFDSEQVITREVAYFHFSRRSISVPEIVLSDYYLVPNEFIKYETLTKELILKYSKDDLGYYIEQKCKKIKKALFNKIKAF